jgi:hypothetical protein
MHIRAEITANKLLNQNWQAWFLLRLIGRIKNIGSVGRPMEPDLLPFSAGVARRILPQTASSMAKVDTSRELAPKHIIVHNGLAAATYALLFERSRDWRTDGPIAKEPC